MKLFINNCSVIFDADLPDPMIRRMGFTNINA